MLEEGCQKLQLCLSKIISEDGTVISMLGLKILVVEVSATYRS